MASLPQNLWCKVLTFLPARRILWLRQLNRQTAHEVDADDGQLQQSCRSRFEARGFADKLIRPASNFLQDPDTMCWCRSLFFGKVDDDGAFWGRGVKPCRGQEAAPPEPLDVIESGRPMRQLVTSMTQQPHDYVTREALAEWLTDTWQRLQQPYNPRDKVDGADPPDVDGEQHEEDGYFDMAGLSWADAVPRQMGTNELCGTHPFFVLHATRHDADDARQRASEINIPDYDMDADSREFFLTGQWNRADATGSAATVPDEPAGNNAWHVADLMFKCCDGLVQLPVWGSDRPPPPTTDVRQGSCRARRHCAEWYFPVWTLNEMRAIGESQKASSSLLVTAVTDREHTSGKTDGGCDQVEAKSKAKSASDFVHFIESSCFESEEVSVYLLCVELGPYLAGVLWVKERDS